MLEKCQQSVGQRHATVMAGASNLCQAGQTLGVNIFLDDTPPLTSPDGCDICFRITYCDLAYAENAIDRFRNCVATVWSPRLLRAIAPLLMPADLLVYPLPSIDWLSKFALSTF
jgi:hypothetical protein